MEGIMQPETVLSPERVRTMMVIAHASGALASSRRHLLTHKGCVMLESVIVPMGWRSSAEMTTGWMQSKPVKTMEEYADIEELIIGAWHGAMVPYDHETLVAALHKTLLDERYRAVHKLAQTRMLKIIRRTLRRHNIGRDVWLFTFIHHIIHRALAFELLTRKSGCYSRSTTTVT